MPYIITLFLRFATGTHRTAIRWSLLAFSS